MSISTWNNLCKLTDKQEEFLLSLEKQKPRYIEDLRHKSELLQQQTSPAPESQHHPELHLQEKISNMQQFYSWWSQVHENADSTDDEQFVEKLNQAKVMKQQCDQILLKLGNGLESLKTLEGLYNTVSKKTGELHHACEKLVEEQTQLTKVTDDIDENLKYFEDFATVSQRLSGQNMRVYDEDFEISLSKVDNCLQFLQNHKQFKDAEIYLKKYEALLINGLSAVKDEILKNIKSVTMTAATTSKQEPNQIEKQELMFSVKFKSLGQKLRPLISHLEKRAQNKAVSALLQSCQEQFNSHRGSLLKIPTEAKLQEISQRHSDLSSLTQEACRYIIDLSKAEFQLYQIFFPSEASLSSNQVTETFASILYTFSRPRYIRSHNIDDLANLIYLLHAEVNSDDLLGRPFGGPVLLVVQRMTQDIQERLIFLSQNFLRELGSYRPTDEDLNYPEKLKEDYQHPEKREKTNFLPKPMYPTWYPTLEKTVVFLSKLYLALSNNKQTFEGIATEAINICSNSIIEASQLLQTKRGIIEANLFLLKHFSTLRKQISPFQVNFQVSETHVDYSAIKNSFRNLFRIGRETTLVAALQQSMPQVQIHQLNSKQDLEKNLKNTVHGLVLAFTKTLLEKALTFITRAQAVLGAKKNLAQEDFASPQALFLLLEETSKEIKTEMPQQLEKICAYVQEPPTVEALTHSIVEHISENLAQLRNLVQTHYQIEDTMKLSEEIETMQIQVQELAQQSLRSAHLKRVPSLSLSMSSLVNSFSKSDSANQSAVQTSTPEKKPVQSSLPAKNKGKEEE